MHGHDCRQRDNRCQHGGNALPLHGKLAPLVDRIGRMGCTGWNDGAMARSRRAVFRLPVVALIFPVVLLLCVIPLAGLGDLWNLMYAVPALALIWTVVTHTAADTSSVRVSGLTRRRTLPWDRIDRVELDGPRWVVAVDRDGGRIRLPMVMAKDLPRLAAASGGVFSFVELDHTEFVQPDPSDAAAAAGEGPQA